MATAGERDMEGLRCGFKSVADPWASQSPRIDGDSSLSRVVMSSQNQTYGTEQHA